MKSQLHSSRNIYFKTIFYRVTEQALKYKKNSILLGKTNSKTGKISRNVIICSLKQGHIIKMKYNRAKNIYQCNLEYHESGQKYNSLYVIMKNKDKTWIICSKMFKTEHG